MVIATSYDTQAVVNAIWGVPCTYTRTGVEGVTAFGVGGVAFTVGGTAFAAGTGEDVAYDLTGTFDERGEEEGRPSYGAYAIRRGVWTFALDALGAARPKMRDVIADEDGVAWVVSKIPYADKWMKNWVLDVSHPYLPEGLNDTATVYRPAPAPDAYGLRVPNPAAVYTGVPCRLQPDTREREFSDDVGKVLTRQKFACVFGEAVTLNAGDTVQVAGMKYEVTGQGEIEELGRLTFAAVERIT